MANIQRVLTPGEGIPIYWDVMTVTPTGVFEPPAFLKKLEAFAFPERIAEYQALFSRPVQAAHVPAGFDIKVEVPSPDKNGRISYLLAKPGDYVVVGEKGDLQVYDAVAAFKNLQFAELSLRCFPGIGSKDGVPVPRPYVAFLGLMAEQQTSKDVPKKKYEAVLTQAIREVVSISMLFKTTLKGLLPETSREYASLAPFLVVDTVKPLLQLDFRKGLIDFLSIKNLPLPLISSGRELLFLNKANEDDLLKNKSDGGCQAVRNNGYGLTDIGYRIREKMLLLGKKPTPFVELFSGAPMVVAKQSAKSVRPDSRQVFQPGDVDVAL